MTVTLDINVLLDVFQKREPYYAASARVVSMVTTGTLTGVCPAHGLTTLYYLVRKHASKPSAESAMDQVLDDFQIGGLDTAGWREARRLSLKDFEDAVVATVAKVSASAFIITRNVSDFAGSPRPGHFSVGFPQPFRCQALKRGPKQEVAGGCHRHPSGNLRLAFSLRSNRRHGHSQAETRERGKRPVSAAANVAPARSDGLTDKDVEEKRETRRVWDDLGCGLAGDFHRRVVDIAAPMPAAFRESTEKASGRFRTLRGGLGVTVGTIGSVGSVA